MEPLKDPVGDRMVKSVPPPPQKPLSDELLFPKGKSGTNSFNAGKPAWKQLRDHMNKEGLISKKHVLVIIEKAKKILCKSDFSF